MLSVVWTVEGDANVELRSFLERDYRLKADLHSWSHTEALLRGILQRNFELSSKCMRVENEGKGGLLEILKTPGEPSAVKILYLSCHVGGNGQLLLSSGEKLFLDELIGNSGEGFGQWEPDLIIVDTCYAASIAYQTKWVSTFPCLYLFVSDTNQLTWDIDLQARKYRGVMDRYPGLIEFASNMIGKAWTGELSDFGFRLAKLALVSPEKGNDPLAWLSKIVDVKTEEAKSRGFRQSTFILRTGESLQELVR